MLKCSFFILCLIYTNISFSSDSKRLTRQESKDVSSKASKIMVNEEHPILEKALERTLTKKSNYKSTEQLEQRNLALDKLSNIEIEEHVEENLKLELMQWAIKELAERNTHEVSQKHGEQKKKWIAASIGLVSTILSIILPVIFSTDDCNCDTK